MLRTTLLLVCIASAAAWQARPLAAKAQLPALARKPARFAAVTASEAASPLDTTPKFEEIAAGAALDGSAAVALGKDARHELHQGRWPARTAPPPRPRDMPRPLDPTRLHVYGLEVLDMPPGQWQAVVAGDHAAPQAEMWSFDPPKW